MKSLIEAAQIPVASSAAPVVYNSVNDLPIATRRSMVRLRRDGLSADQIASKLALPVHWVLLFVETPPGATQH